MGISNWRLGNRDLTLAGRNGRRGIALVEVSDRRARLWRASSRGLASGRAGFCGGALAAIQGSILEIPHVVRPAHQGDSHRNGVDRPGFTPAADVNLEVVIGIDPGLAGALIRIELGDFEDERCERAGVACATAPGTASSSV